MSRSLIIAAIAASVVASLLADPFDATAEPPAGRETVVLIPQDEFPCEEDEVLGYAPEFGPDHVGCIHIEIVNQEMS